MVGSMPHWRKRWNPLAHSEGWKRFARVLDVLERKGARICR